MSGYGSWFSSIVDSVGGWVAGDGNPAGNPDTRSLGYDPVNVGQAAAVILSQPSAPSVQSELLFMGAAGVALIFLLRSPGRRG